MSKQNQRDIHAARLALILAQRRAASTRTRERKQAEKSNAALELLLDEIAAEGIDLNTAFGQQVLATVIAMRAARSGAQDEERGNGDLFFNDNEW